MAKVALTVMVWRVERTVIRTLVMKWAVTVSMSGRGVLGGRSPMVVVSV